MNKTRLINVILFGLCAAIWSFKAIYVIINKPYPTTSFLSVLDVICAVVWIVAFIVSIKRYRSSKDK